MRLFVIVAALTGSLLFPARVSAQEAAIAGCVTCAAHERVSSITIDAGMVMAEPVKRLIIGPLPVIALQQPQAQHQAPPAKSWIRRHPILTGALIGSGVGAAFGASTCSFGFLGYGTCSPSDRAWAALLSGGAGAAAGALWGAVINVIIN